MNEPSKLNLAGGFLERWAAKAAALTAILTLVFLVLPQLRPKEVESQELRPRSIADAPSVPPNDAPDELSGRWRQYDAPSDRYMSTFQVSKGDGNYVMSMINVANDPDVGTTRGVFDVRFDGTTWTFSSDWGDGRIGQFILHEVSQGEFAGDIYFRGELVGRTRWVRDH